ncbi:hypothetical protein N9Y40_02810 [Porticoccaceae bacterium]|nr:hypothetical protein [Porticoccaceae bacterium]
MNSLTGQDIFHMRKGMGLSRKEFAELTFYSADYIRHLETGVHDVQDETERRIIMAFVFWGGSEAYGINVGYRDVIRACNSCIKSGKQTLIDARAESLKRIYSGLQVSANQAC